MAPPFTGKVFLASGLLSRVAFNSEGSERARCLQKSDTLLIAAAMPCRAAGASLDLSSFDRAAVCPDWSDIDEQIAWFAKASVARYGAFSGHR
jgi:hypothetical protein